jgi:hypothetical protein
MLRGKTFDGPEANIPNHSTKYDKKIVGAVTIYVALNAGLAWLVVLPRLPTTFVE